MAEKCGVSKKTSKPEPKTKPLETVLCQVSDEMDQVISKRLAEIEKSIRTQLDILKGDLMRDHVNILIKAKCK